MPNYKLTNKAIKDLKSIWNYTFDTWSENQADKYYEQILKYCERLSAEPEKGKKYFGLIDGLRGSKINKHIIFYREISKNTIEIERVLHEQMDLKSHLEE
jgi:toxin ParE1/3/4